MKMPDVVLSNQVSGGYPMIAMGENIPQFGSRERASASSSASPTIATVRAKPRTTYVTPPGEWPHVDRVSMSKAPTWNLCPTIKVRAPSTGSRSLIQAGARVRVQRCNNTRNVMLMGL